MQNASGSTQSRTIITLSSLSFSHSNRRTRHIQSGNIKISVIDEAEQCKYSILKSHQAQIGKSARTLSVSDNPPSPLCKGGDKINAIWKTKPRPVVTASFHVNFAI
jgi:hypothetical protein